MPKSNLGIIINELFQVSLVTYLILLLLETLDKGFVSNVFNLNYLLAVVLISGIIKVLPVAEKKLLSQWDLIDLKFMNLRSQLHLPKSFSENDFYFILLIGLTGGTLVYFKTEDLGRISILISVITTIIIFLLSYLIFTDQDSGEVD